MSPTNKVILQKEYNATTVFDTSHPVKTRPRDLKIWAKLSRSLFIFTFLFQHSRHKEEICFLPQEIILRVAQITCRTNNRSFLFFFMGVGREERPIFTFPISLSPYPFIAYFIIVNSLIRCAFTCSNKYIIMCYSSVFIPLIIFSITYD